MREEKETPQQRQLPILKLKSESGSETVHYPLVYDGFPEEFRRMAEKELNETEQKRIEGTEKLKEILKKENMPILGDTTLLAVLRSCKYNFEKSETKLKKFVASRQEIVNKVAVLDMMKAEKILDDMGTGLLPYRDSVGRAIVYTRPYGMNFNAYDCDDLGTVIMCALLFLLSQPITSAAGIVYIGECKSPSIYMYFPIIKSLHRFVWYWLQFPLRIAKFEIMNENSPVRLFVRGMRPFVSEKIYKRLELHGGSYDRLCKLYGLNLLPDVFGGTRGSLSNKSYKQKLLDFMMELKTEMIK